mmetsp:Transcript_10086/g.33090  ORF Transcript_10086/g.33090 Transcript_10086/m.33090 type:complete len:283 (-) Transcript_10086:44-892(-)
MRTSTSSLSRRFRSPRPMSPTSPSTLPLTPSSSSSVSSFSPSTRSSSARIELKRSWSCSSRRRLTATTSVNIRLLWSASTHVLATASCFAEDTSRLTPSRMASTSPWSWSISASYSSRRRASSFRTVRWSASVACRHPESSAFTSESSSLKRLWFSRCLDKARAICMRWPVAFSRMCVSSSPLSTRSTHPNSHIGHETVFSGHTRERCEESSRLRTSAPQPFGHCCGACSHFWRCSRTRRRETPAPQYSHTVCTKSHSPRCSSRAARRHTCLHNCLVALWRT